MKKINTKKSYIFTLQNIKTEKIDQKFGITIVSNINSSNNTPLNTTKISDLSYTKNIPEIVSFLDDSKKKHKCTISMVDFNTNKELISGVTYDCFWCRSKIPTNVIAIGCPIKYAPNQAIKTYYSEISKDTYTIKENITSTKLKEIKVSDDTRLTILNKGYYITDGIFCSFNCCMSYIIDNRTNSMYILSEMLLLKMYNEIYEKPGSPDRRFADVSPSQGESIEQAPHWRTLVQYGGDLTIEEFRNSFNKIEYQKHGYVTHKFKPIGMLFEEKLKF